MSTSIPICLGSFREVRYSHYHIHAIVSYLLALPRLSFSFTIHTSFYSRFGISSAHYDPCSEVSSRDRPRAITDHKLTSLIDITDGRAVQFGTVITRIAREKRLRRCFPRYHLAVSGNTVLHPPGPGDRQVQTRGPRVAPYPSGGATKVNPTALVDAILPSRNSYFLLRIFLE